MSLINYNPDVLTCLANLSSDEVFTSPVLANAMLDLLPAELWTNPNTKILDPAVKSGVFLREAAKRLLKGLEPVIPDLQKRVDHIFKHQLYGIAITELTSYMARRSIYCSKVANGKYSVTQFKTEHGNIMYRPIQHTWDGDKCVYCGASKDKYDGDPEKESHAYRFIHMSDSDQELKELFKDVKFDLIISNPPYQLSDGGTKSGAIPIYQRFVEQAKKLKPRYISMIIPSRWMTGGRYLDQFRDVMIHDKNITEMHDFLHAEECFSGVEIKGGVCYFLWSRDVEGMCNIYLHDNDEILKTTRYLCEEGDSIHIRYPQMIDIKNKVWAQNEESFSSIVSSMKPYGLRGDFFKDPQKYGYPPISKIPIKNGYSIHGLDNLKRKVMYIPKDYPLKITTMLDDYKIFITRNYGEGNFGDVPANPIIAGPGELCTETYLQIGPFKSQNEASNVLRYINTKFFRAMVSIRKQDQGASKAVYQYVPLLDHSKSWSDEELYKKFNLSEIEISFIEEMIPDSYQKGN